jgi:hypothetical protein
MNRLADQIYFWLKTIASCIYYVAFLAISIGVFLECRETRHAWVVSDALNGIFGGVLLVYPFNICRYGANKTLENWIGWLLFMFILVGISLVISKIIGFA